MAMMHNDLVTYYERIFAFRQYHQWSITEIENLLPWELDVMIGLLANYMDKIETDRKQTNLNRQMM